MVILITGRSPRAPSARSCQGVRDALYRILSMGSVAATLHGWRRGSASGSGDVAMPPMLQVLSRRAGRFIHEQGGAAMKGQEPSR
jgi:hypothetical protein